MRSYKSRQSIQWRHIPVEKDGLATLSFMIPYDALCRYSNCKWDETFTRFVDWRNKECAVLEV